MSSVTSRAASDHRQAQSQCRMNECRMSNVECREEAGRQAGQGSHDFAEGQGLLLARYRPKWMNRDLIPIHPSHADRPFRASHSSLCLNTGDCTVLWSVMIGEVSMYEVSMYHSLSGSLIPQSKLKLGEEELLYSIHRPRLNVLRIYSTSDQQGDHF